MSIVTRRRKSTGNELIPLINIVFLLLIFFMVAGSIQPSVPVEMEHPIADMDNPIKAVRVQIALSEKNEIYLNDDLLSLEQLKTTIELLVDQNKSAEELFQLEVSLHVDHRVTAGQLDRVLNVVRRHEIKKIGLITQKKADA